MTLPHRMHRSASYPHPARSSVDNFEQSWRTWHAACVELEPSDFRDPGEVLANVAATHVIENGDVLLVLVRDPSTEQAVEHVHRLDRRSWGQLDDDWDLARFLGDQVRRLPIPPRGARLRHSVLTVVARRGFAVFGGNELRWMNAWRWSNHLMDAHSGDIALLTEHGWYDFSTDWGGKEPRLAS